MNKFLKNNPDKTKVDFPYAEFDASYLTMLVPSGKYEDVYQFSANIGDVSRFTFLGMNFYCLETAFLDVHRENGGMKTNLFVNEKLLNGYEPKTGDNVQGVVQLNAFIDPPKPKSGFFSALFRFFSRREKDF